MGVTAELETLVRPLAKQAAARESGTPVVLLGGEANALSVARQLGRQGVPVFVIGELDASTRTSRYCRGIGVPGRGPAEDVWTRFLLGPASDHLVGSVLLACSDPGLRVIAGNRDALLTRYKLDACEPGPQLLMLDKLSTYQHAAMAGVPTPGFWVAQTREQIMAVRRELVFPLMVKPRLSHLFEQRFGSKYVMVADLSQLLDAFETTSAAGIDVLLMEWIPGADDRLCSYYTYVDEEGTALFDFTKRIIRRYPTGMGTASYHITDWVPEIVPLAKRLLKEVGLRGVANLEFKWDQRDGQYKLIECNARFTASNALVASSGCDVASFVYNRLVGRSQPLPGGFRWGLRLWDPIRDFWAFMELRKRGELTTGQWLRSLLHRQMFPYFNWSDPLPAIARATKPLRRWLRNRRPKRAVRPDRPDDCPVSSPTEGGI